jgi:Fur family transcriptional regulator, peroxide stress response regulator
MSLPTVYSTLTLLKKEGLIRELEFNNADNRYEANTSDHLNLVCLGCRKMFDFKKGKFASTEKIQSAAGFLVTGMRFEYYGYCKECKPTC